MLLLGFFASLSLSGNPWDSLAKWGDEVLVNVPQSR